MTAERLHYRCKTCCYSLTNWSDESLDETGLLPEVLLRLSQASTLLPYRQACKLLESWGVEISKSQGAQLSGQYQLMNQAQGREHLLKLAELPLTVRLGRAKRWIIEVDGKFVPLYEEKCLEWREVKTAVLYPMNSPSERYYLSDLATAEDFSAQVHGLLRHAGVSQEDELIGISDGASWIANLMGDLGVKWHILDVYHASLYLERVMVALCWNEVSRVKERASLLRGEIDIQRWLNHHIKGTDGWSDEGIKALAYLEKQALLDHTRYPYFKVQGIAVIGSGQIEGANKSVIGGRLNVSGAHWSEQGARAMAFARAEYYSHRALNDFNSIRLLAFPRAA